MTHGAAGQHRRLAIVSDAIYPFTRGGKELRIHALSQQLAKSNLDVHIYTMKWWSGTNTLQQDGVTLHAICPKIALYTKSGRRSIWQGIVFAVTTLRLLTVKFDVLEVDHMPIIPLFLRALLPASAAVHYLAFGTKSGAKPCGRTICHGLCQLSLHCSKD
ncbi:hypothetical protein IPG36_04320 [bacterium]|nr:MAG: hypothetical protein IPG36_04320 [bacterium]